MPKKTVLKNALLAGAVMGILAGCNNKDDGDSMDTMDTTAAYTVTVTNITANQPLTPPAVVVHQPAYVAWDLGMPASVGLEKLAESGDNTDFLAAADADPAVKMSGTSSNGPFAPGSSETVMVEGAYSADLQVSIASMMANTNDAFAGVAGRPIGGLGVGESVSFALHAHDAGTEKNTETKETVPGPAGGGEGFNATRDDVDFVSIHAGVVTAADGLATSILDESHRWLGEVAKVTVTRTQ